MFLVGPRSPLSLTPTYGWYTRQAARGYYGKVRVVECLFLGGLLGGGLLLGSCLLLGGGLLLCGSLLG